MAHFVYLSPHLDDAALSCGGQIALQTRTGSRVWVVTAFAGDPPGPLSPFARALHQRWELGDDAPAARRAEDLAALARLGAVALHWELPDCIYRCDAAGAPLYAGYEALWGAIHPADERLVEPLAQRIAALPAADALYAPLGAGSHVDHRLLRRAAEASGRALVFYEEYPYAEDPSAVEAVVGPGWAAELVLLDEEALTARSAAVACYRSQISSFWRDAEEMTARLRAYALRVGDGRPAERRWRRAA